MKAELAKKFYAVLDAFDFDKVHMAMEAMGWTWGMEEEHRVPKISEMRDMCSELFGYALDVYSQKKKAVSSSSGGFKVSISKKGSVKVSFILAETRYDSEISEVY